MNQPLISGLVMYGSHDFVEKMPGLPLDITVEKIALYVE